MENEQILGLLSQIEKNQRELIALQQKSLEAAEQRTAEAQTSMRETMTIQRMAVRRQKIALVTLFVLMLVIAVKAGFLF